MKRYTHFFLILTVILPVTAISQNFDFNILPLSLNPAFTGLFDGRLRASAIYKHQWPTSKVPFTAYGLSIDGRSKANAAGYFAAGASLLEGRADDQSIKNFSGMASAAYHKIIRGTGRNSSHVARRAEVAAGIQLGYIQRNIDLSGSEYRFLPYAYQLGTGARYLVANAGASFSQLVNSNFSYTAGLAGNNLNLLNDGTVNVQNPLLRLTPSATALLTANWTLPGRLNLRPAILHIFGKSFYVGGSEFRFRIGQPDHLRTVFIGAWYRTGHVFTTNFGYEFSYFRFATGFDYCLPPGGSSGIHGFQLVGRYIMPRRQQPRNE